MRISHTTKTLGAVNANNPVGIGVQCFRICFLRRLLIDHSSPPISKVCDGCFISFGEYVLKVPSKRGFSPT
jgi:hypothetical protein